MRILISIALVLIFVGCKTNEAPLTTDQATAQAIIAETEEANEAADNQRQTDLNALGGMLLEEVTTNCDRAHRQFLAGAQPVDCHYTYPTDLTLSFPDFEYHNAHVEHVGKFFNRWCSAIWHLTGKASHFTRIARENHYSERMACEVPE